MNNVMRLFIYVLCYSLCTWIFHYNDMRPVTSTSCNLVTTQLEFEFVEITVIAEYPGFITKIFNYRKLNNIITIYENAHGGIKQKLIYIKINMNNMSSSYRINVPYAIKISKRSNSKFDTAKLFSIYLLNSDIQINRMATSNDNSSLFIIFPPNSNLNNQIVLIRYNNYVSSLNNYRSSLSLTNAIPGIFVDVDTTSGGFNTDNNIIIAPMFFTYLMLYLKAQFYPIYYQ